MVALGKKTGDKYLFLEQELEPLGPAIDFFDYHGAYFYQRDALDQDDMAALGYVVRRSNARSRA